MGRGRPKNAITHSTAPSEKNQNSSPAQRRCVTVARAKAVKNVWVRIAQVGSRKIAKINFTQRVGTVSSSDAGTKVLDLARATLRTTFRPRFEFCAARLLVDLLFRLLKSSADYADCDEFGKAKFGTRRLAAELRHLGKLPRWTGWQPVFPRTPRLCPSQIRAGASIDLDRFAFLDEERNVDFLSSFERGGLRNIARSIAAQAFRRFDNLQINRRRQFNLNGLAFRIEDLQGQIFHEVIFGIADQVFLQRDGVVRLRIDEVISVAILITKFELFSLDLDQLHLISRTKADISAFAGVDVADNRLDKRAQISRRSVMHFEHNGCVAIVFYGHSSAKIVGCGHGERRDSLQGYIVTTFSVKTLKADAEFKCSRRSCNCSSHWQSRRLPYNSLSRVKSWESTMPTGTLSSSITTRSSMRWRSSRLSTSTASLSLCTVTGFNVIRSATSRSPILESD